MSIHDGHRQRLKNRFLSEGLDNFEELQVLELLLFYCIPRQDTNPIAHRLLDDFGSFAQVMEASPEELKKVSGIGDSVATFLSLVTAAGRYYSVKQQNAEVKILSDLEDCGKYLTPYFRSRRNETVFLLCLDAKCKVLCCKEVGEGSVNSAAVPIRRIVEMALGANATSVVLAHNHPSGVALPSNEDVQTTFRLAMALNSVEITLIDHMVVADDDFVSMRQSGVYDPNRCQVLL
ncbi:MAG: DNA repair protein RadC [Oscillospiraceae bacterium]|nr:DNA repair protein RadC [Oscillospiraceae bacterium]